MKKILALLAMLSVVGAAFAQQAPPTQPAPEPPKVIRVIKIRHASPLLIWLLLHGQTTFNTPPEPGIGPKG